MNPFEFFQLLYKQKFLILIIISIFFFGSVATSLIITPKYQASATLAPVENKLSIEPSGLAGQLLGGAAGGEQRNFLEVARSKIFFMKFYENDELMNTLINFESYSSSTGLDKFKDQNFDYKTNNWVGEKPPFLKSYEIFFRSVSIYNRTYSNLIQIDVVHESPNIAYIWSNWIVDNLDLYFKEKETRKAENSLEYLQNQIKMTSNIELQRVIAALIQKDIQTLSLSGSSESFALEILDKPFKPEQKIYPRRSFIVLVGTLLGMFLSIFTVIIINAGTYNNLLGQRN